MTMAMGLMRCKWGLGLWVGTVGFEPTLETV